MPEVAPRPFWRGGTGERLARLDTGEAWLVDPAAGFDGRGSLVVEDGVITRVTASDSAASATAPSLLLMPGLADLHCHVREARSSGTEDATTVLAAAARGGYTCVCLMANLTPATDRPALLAALMAAVAASGSPVRALPLAAVTVGRAGQHLTAMAALAAAGAVAFSDDGAPVGDSELLRAALTTAGTLHRPIIEHPEDLSLTGGSEANEGLAATILGLRGAPAAAEWAAVSRAVAILRQVLREAPPPAAPRLHLTHLSTAESLDLVRAAKTEGLAVTCDVTPHHLCLHDGWVGGDRRFAWDVTEAWNGLGGAPPFDTSTRVNPPLRSAADAKALWRGLADGTVDAIATDHAPHREVDKSVPYGEAPPGISGIETALGLVLAGVEAGCLDLTNAVRALTQGPWRVLGADLCGAPPPSLAVGAPADLVLVDRSVSAAVNPAAFASRARNTALAGISLPGKVLLTVAGGRVAYADPSTIS